MANVEKVKECLLGNTDSLIEVVSMINSYDGSLEHLDLRLNDEDFFDSYFSHEPYELAKRITYGDYKTHHEFVGFDGYGNLVSYEKYEYKEMLENEIDDIMKSLIENINNIDVEHIEILKDLQDEITE